MVGGVLFQGIAEEEQRTLLDCLQARARHYARGETVLRAGEPTQALGVVVSGSVHIESSDAWGNRSILDKLGPGQIFAEVYACIPGERLMVTVVAAEDTEVLLLRVDRLLEQGTEPTGGRDRLIRNLLEATARKNLHLTQKIFHTAPKTIRGKVLAYLSFQSARQGGRQFSIPFNRQQLADYLGVDRSALSSELGRLKREGVLDFRRNVFRLMGNEIEEQVTRK